MRIKDFEIKNLYGKYSFKSQLDEKVNIIVGNNGAFKSTLLEIVRRIMTAIIISHESTEEKTITDYENAYISFDNDIVLHSLISSERRHEVDKIKVLQDFVWVNYLSLGVSFKTQRRRVIEINADRPEGAEACQRHLHEYAECCAASLRPPKNALA